MKKYPLDVKDLTLWVGEKSLLDKANLSLTKGEVTLLIGLNGSGKTTLLNTLVGLHSDYQGEVRLGGRELAHYTSKDRSKYISYLPQFIERQSHVTVSEYLDMCRYVQSQGKLEYYQDDLGIDKLSHLYVDQLSGGELRKVALMGCLLQNPTVLLLDEPFQHLDPGNKKVFFDVLAKLKRDGLSIFLVSHDYTWSQKIADHVLGIVDKHIVKGEGKEFFEKVMKHPFEFNHTHALVPVIGEKHGD